MVAGKVKVAMGLQKSSPKPETISSPTVFSRSFGVYFPRTSSAQVQPRPRDITELVQLVEELRDRESRLKTELIQQKLLTESAGIVPILEEEIALKNVEIGKLEGVIEGLRLEVQCLMSLENEIESRDGEIESLAKRVGELEGDNCRLRLKIEGERRESEKRLSEILEEKRLGGSMRIVDSSSHSMRFHEREGRLLKSVKKSVKPIDFGSESKREEAEMVCPQLSRCNSLDEFSEFSDLSVKCRLPRVPVPPPTPSSLLSSPSSSSSSKGFGSFPIPPPPPPPTLARLPPPLPRPKSASPPMGKTPPLPLPPPPPLLAKGARLMASKVKRVPEVVEFYNSLMHHRDSKRDSGIGVSDAQSNGNARDMIGEIENRSAHLLAIKMDVETQGDFIRFLMKEVQNATFTNITDVVAFVKWLDDELSYLVDERAVLKHFEWPESKADALREAAFGYCDIKKLETDALSMRDDIREPCSSALKKMQALLEKLEHGVYNLSRMRESESASKKYKGFNIPTDWVLETGLANQIKLTSVKLAMMYMRRISAELEAVGSGHETEELMLQGVRFAFRVHQFAGGFDVETMHAFQELRNKAGSRL
ncbi:hypothetical protein GIB67_012098 [Kingdonia uniflora]|uniref:Protein CHUP1, chloroplastic n=1 Tax=Kingdonia uniflora TaxID=39325 RepID=A0A7J7LI69_9MAGN|nr:hypothetical protein GIB67_012098 [Kingdonia uniflora]